MIAGAATRLTVLEPAFFARPVLQVAPDLLGKFLVRGDGLARIITEVEAYDGPDDRACHGHHGRTPRTAVMFGPAGHWYVYLCYGMHWMLNVVTGPTGYPAAVLIRGVEGVSGPGRVTNLFGIDKRFNARALQPAGGLWIEDRGHRVARSAIRQSPRIGVGFAGTWAQKPYRFHL